MPEHNPREGHSTRYLSWNNALKRFCREHKFDYDTIEPPPPDVTSHRYSTKSNEERKRAHAQDLHEWQQRATKLFNAIEPNLLLSGVTYAADRRKIDQMIRGELANGPALIRWVRAFASYEDTESQAELQLQLHRLVSSRAAHVHS